MPLIENTPGGVRFERGAGPAGVLAAVVIVGLMAVAAFKAGQSAGPIAGVVTLLVGLGLAAGALKAIATMPVQYLELDSKRKALVFGTNRKGERTREEELPLEYVQRLEAMDRGGGGASWTLAARMVKGKTPPQAFVGRVRPDGLVDLLKWTQESKATIDELLAKLGRFGAPVK